MGRRSKHKTRRAGVKELTKAKKKLRSQSRVLYGGSESSTQPSSSHTVDSLLAKAEECLDSFQLELASKFCQRALDTVPRDVRALDMIVPLHLELGDTDKAIETAISLRPNEGHSKYLYMGQLTSGEDAVGYFRKGIELMTAGQEVGGACLGGGASNDDISNAYCSLAEVYLTDECFASDAGKLCYESCSKALEWCPSNPDAYNLMASCLISQNKQEEAKSVLVRGLLLWLPMKEKPDSTSAATTSKPVGEEGSHSDPSGVVPCYPSRVNCAKLLLELREHERAFDVLEGLMCEDDEVVVVWYLMGWLHYLTEDMDSARFYLQHTQTLYAKLDCDDTAMLEHTTELLEELGPKDQDKGDEELGPEDQDKEIQEEGDLESDCDDMEVA